MARNSTDVEAPVAVIWSVLADPRQYARFVKGTKRVRRFEPSWPEIPSRFHQTVGVGPMMLRGVTRVVGSHPPESLHLEAGLGPLGSTDVVFTVEAGTDGLASVTIEEHALTGPARVAWNPLFDAGLALRNRLLLSRLRRIAEQRAATALRTSSNGG